MAPDQPYADPGIFVRGGPGQSDKKSSYVFFCFFLSSAYFAVKWSISFQFQRNLSFFKVPEGVQHFPGGVQLFPGGGGGGSNCLFPIETHITWDFPGGGPDPLSPPLDPHLSTGLRSLISLYI